MGKTGRVPRRSTASRRPGSPRTKKTAARPGIIKRTASVVGRTAKAIGGGIKDGLGYNAAKGMAKTGYKAAKVGVRVAKTSAKVTGHVAKAGAKVARKGLKAYAGGVRRVAGAIHKAL